MLAVRSPVTVVVARLDVPVAVNVPATRFVVVALVAVKLVKNEVTAVKSEAKKLDEVALVVEAFVAKKLVLVLLVVEALVAIKRETVVVAKETVPVAVRFPVAREVEVALPNEEVAVIVREVKVGLSEKRSVEVEEKVRLDDVVVKYERGLEKKLFQLVEDAVRGSV